MRCKHSLPSFFFIAFALVVVLAGCSDTARELSPDAVSVAQTVWTAREANPNSAQLRCRGDVFDDMDRLIDRDPLACHCLEVQGRDPACWKFDEYVHRPMDPALSEAPRAVAQAAEGAPDVPLDAIVNAASFANRTLPGGGVARGSIFSIFGSNLGPAGGVAVTQFPLSTELGGVRIRVFTSTESVEAIPLFVSAGQINAIMPSNAPIGFAAVEVTYNGVTGDVSPVRIEASAVGIFTATGAGYGPGSITNFVSQTEAPPNSAAVSAAPGQYVTIWVTGLGAIAGADTQQPIDVGAVQDLRPTLDSFELYIGAKLVTAIFYAGRSAEFSGLDQIVAQVPADAQPGCNVPVNIVTNGLPSNAVTMSIGEGPCSDPPNPLQSLASSEPGSSASVSFLRIAGSLRGDFDLPFEAFGVDIGSAVFERSEGGVLSFSPVFSPPPPGSCVVSPSIDLNPDLIGAPDPETLDGGATIVVTRFDGQVRTIMLDDETPAFGGRLPDGSPDPAPALYFEPGAYTITSDGGADIGPIDTAVTLSALPVWTGRDDLGTVRRTEPLHIAWMGGAADQVITIIGSSTNGITNGSNGFVCSARGSDGGIDIAAYILSSLPPGEYREDGGLMLFTTQIVGTFNATGADRGEVFYGVLEFVPVLFE